MNIFIWYYLSLFVSFGAGLCLLALWLHDLYQQRQVRKRRRLALELHPFLWRPSREPRANVRRA